MLEQGTVLEGRYEVKGRLGGGGTSQVYAAYDREKKRNRAIKEVLAPQGSQELKRQVHNMVRWVDSTNSQYENTVPSPALALSQTSQLVWNAQFLGQNYTLSLDPFNRLEQGRKTYASLTTPQSVRLLEQAYSLAVYSWNKFYISYREEQFRQNVESQE